jgi:hypothetical protein
MFVMAGLTFLAGGTVVYKKVAHTLARPIRRLSPVLRRKISLPSAPVVKIDGNPYAALQDRALILQGRNKDGKTTLLRTSLPWWRSVGPWAHYGIYLNGEAGRGVDSFEKWQTTQMYGMTTTAGSEINMSLDQYRESQWLRTYLQLLKFPVAPKPAIVLVDQFEDLLKRYPAQALDWANVLTNQHVRFGLAQVVFVVNSDACTRTLLNLNQGDRFDVLIMHPASGKVPHLDEELYEQCRRNIGLYKNVEPKVKAGKVEDVETYALKKLQRWEEDFHIPYPYKYDPSWSDLAPPPELSPALLKLRLGQGLEQALREQKGPGGPTFTKSQVAQRMGIANRCLTDLDKQQILDATAAQWEERLASGGAEQAVAESLAKHIRRLIGNPAPAPATVAPNEHDKGQSEPRSEA